MIRDATSRLLHGDLLAIATGVLLGFAAFNLVESLVGGLITPIIAALFAEPEVQFMQFTINNSPFYYGAFINAVTVFLFTAGLILAAAYAITFSRGHFDSLVGRRSCPECTSWISKAAKRCPRCTAPIAPASTNA